MTSHTTRALKYATLSRQRSLVSALRIYGRMISTASQSGPALSATGPERMTEPSSIKGCLAHGYPIVFGFTVYPSIDRAEAHGVLPMPGTSEREDGGHCVVLVGYNDKDRHFIVRNSWGTDWGDEGYFYMPYEYVLRSDLSTDFWTIERVG
jgi:C1A family cysteine protease